MPCLIDDGQTLQTFIRGIKGQFDDFYCERRPTLPGERNRATNRASRAEKFGDWQEYDAAYNELVAAKLTWWNVQGKQGAAAITAENVAKLPPALWDRLTNVALGIDHGDLPPDASEQERAEFQAALAAEKEGRAPGDAQAEAARKN